MKEAGDDLVLAGGFIRSCVANEPVNDVDLFVKNPSKAEYFAWKLKPEKGKLIKTDNAITITGLPFDVQIITRWVYECPEFIVPSFDFTVAQAALWFDSEFDHGIGRWSSLISPRFYADLAAKRLIYTNPERNEDAGGSLLRVLKFYQRGYRIPLDSLSGAIVRLLKGVESLTPEDELHEAITGLLHEVDPAIDFTHQAHLPAENSKLERNQDDQQQPPIQSDQSG
jgi:hypothetical protein